MSDSSFTPLKGLRGMIARNLSQAWQAPRVAQGITVNMTNCQNRIDVLRQETGVKVTITHLLLKALAKTLQDHPDVNATISPEGIQREEDINISVAIATDFGLLVPVIKNVDEKPLVDLVGELQDLATKARANQLPASAYQKGTFTLSALGATGIDWFTPVLNPPQVAILGVGTVRDQPIVNDGQIETAPMMEITLVFDHRALDGFPAGLFLNDLKRHIEDAEF